MSEALENMNKQSRLASNDSDIVDNKGDDSNKCGICLSELKLSTELDCSHIFCFLCIKGWSMKKSTCPLCRTDIDEKLLNNIKLNDDKIINDVIENKYKWFYAGRNGWWAFDEDTSLQLENLHQKYKQDPTIYDSSQHKLRIGSVEYQYDFENMLQISTDGKTRRINRSENMDTDIIKGVAGLRMNHVY
jgi:E3 ubiquitin-protein ligase RNF146